MKRESLTTPTQPSHFQSRSGILDHTSGTYSHVGLMDYPRVRIKEWNLGKILVTVRWLALDHSESAETSSTDVLGSAATYAGLASRPLWVCRILKHEAPRGDIPGYAMLPSTSVAPARVWCETTHAGQPTARLSKVRCCSRLSCLIRTMREEIVTNLNQKPYL